MLATVNVHRAESWEEIRARWDQLWRESPYRSFFLSAAWVDAWVTVFGAELRPSFLVFASGQTVVGMCALVFRSQQRGPIAIRQLFLHTDGEGRDEDLCLEYNNLLVLAGWETSVVSVLAEYLRGEKWDELVCNGFTPGAPLDSMRIAFRKTVEAKDQRRSYYVNLDELRASGTAYKDAIARGMRKQINHNRKIYEADGPITVEMAAGQEQRIAFLRELIELHQASWAARGVSGAFTSPRFRAFHEKLISENSSVMLARVGTPRRTIGVIYTFVRDRKVYFYQSGLAYEQDHRIKPGFVSLSAFIQHCLDEGYAEFDFLAGDSHYKRLLSTHSRHIEWVKFRRPTLKNTAIEIARKWRNSGANAAAAMETGDAAEGPFKGTAYPASEWPKFRAVWARLAKSSPHASPFLNAEWVESWIDAFGNSLHVEIFCVTSKDTPVGICLLAYVIRNSGLIRQVHLNTAGEDPWEDTAIEYNSIVCEAGKEHDVVAALWRYLAAKPWDELHAPGMRPGPVTEALLQFFGEGQYSVKTQERPAYLVNIGRMAENGDTFERHLPRKTRQQLRQTIKLYGPTELTPAITESDAQQMFTDMVKLHQESWIARGQRGAFASDRLVQFHRAFISKAFDKGIVQLLRLTTIAGKTIGIRYNFLHRGCVYCYQSGLQYQADRHFKPGYLLHAAAASYNADKGLKEYDLMAGGAHYKHLLADASRGLLWLEVRRNGPKIHLTEFLRRIKRNLRRNKHGEERPVRHDSGSNNSTPAAHVSSAE